MLDKYHQGNIFTGVCQSFHSQGDVCLSACWDTPPWADTPSLGRHPQSRHAPGQTPPSQTSPSQTPPTDTPLGRHCPYLPGRYPPRADTTHPPHPDGHCSGRYASYWNAFFVISFHTYFEDFSTLPIYFLFVFSLHFSFQWTEHQFCCHHSFGFCKITHLGERTYQTIKAKTRFYKMFNKSIEPKSGVVLLNFSSSNQSDQENLI